MPPDQDFDDIDALPEIKMPPPPGDPARVRSSVSPKDAFRRIAAARAPYASRADDSGTHRRERALVQAQALPIKLVFPLVLCFLPGIFVWTLGPAFYQFLQVIDSVLRTSGA